MAVNIKIYQQNKYTVNTHVRQVLANFMCVVCTVPWAREYLDMRLMCIYIYVYMCAYTIAALHAHTHTHTYTHTDTHKHTHTHITHTNHTHTQTHTHTHHTHTHRQEPFRACKHPPLPKPTEHRPKCTDRPGNRPAAASHTA